MRKGNSLVAGLYQRGLFWQEAPRWLADAPPLCLGVWFFEPADQLRQHRFTRSRPGPQEKLPRHSQLPAMRGYGSPYCEESWALSAKPCNITDREALVNYTTLLSRRLSTSAAP